MHDNWAEVRRQMEQVLISERAQRQACRRQQPSVWQSLRQWGAIAVRFTQGIAPAISTTHMRLPRQRTVQPAVSSLEEESTHMTTQRSIQKQTYRWRLLPGLILLWVLTLVLGFIQPAQAQTVTPGAVVGWGGNGWGQLDIPAGLGGVTAIAAGAGHSLALKADGTVVGWGDNSSGQLDIPAGLSGVIAVAVGERHSLALKADGTVVGWGDNSSGQFDIPAGLSGVIAIAAGDLHSLALKDDGTVVSWGDNTWGQLNIPAGLSGVTAITVGVRHSLALKDDGTVVGWGDGSYGRLDIPGDLSDVVAIAAGITSSMALKRNGTVVAWGNNNYGQLNIPDGLSGVTAIAAGLFHNLALKSDGTVVAWGDNGNGQSSVPADLSDVIAIAGGGDYSLAIRRDNMPPTANPSQTPTTNGAGWNNTNVTVNWNWTDGGTGIDPANCTTSTLVSDQGELTLNATCVDLAGNSGSASYPLRVDKTKPLISAAPTSTPNANGWYNSAVTVNFICTDEAGGSGIATNTVAGANLSSEGAGQSITNTGACVDNAGNRAAPVTVSDINIDQTAPDVSVTGVSNAASYPLGSVPAAGCTTHDALSGVATQATVVISGGNPDSSGVYTATCSGATDNAGNSGRASVTYNVVYHWTGFFQPVDNLPVANTVNAGTNIPVKFSLGGNFGLNIFASGYPKVQTVACPNSGSGGSDAIEETVTAGNSTLQYDPSTQAYTYVWKTDKAWAGTCRQLTVKLIDGSEHSAFFQFNGKVRSASAGDEGEMVQQLFLPLVSR